MKKSLYILLGLGLLTSCEKTTEEQCKAKKTEVEDATTALESLQQELDSLKTLLGPDTTAKASMVVRVNEASLSDFSSYFEVHGVIETNKNIQVVPETQGIIKAIRVKEGQKVKKGTTLAILDTELIQKRINEVKTAVELATTMFQKQQNLKDANVGTDVQYIQAKNQKESLERSLSTLQSQLGMAIIVAPISGTIDDIFMNEGEMASSGRPFARMVNIDNVFISADVSEAYLGRVKIGDEVNVSFASLDENIDAEITYIGSYIKPMNRTFSIHVDLKNKKKTFLPNLLATVKVRNAFLKQALVIPTKIVQNDGTNAYVYVAEKGSVTKKIVTVGPDYKGNTVITDGLIVGDKIVVEGQTLVSEGVLVDIVK